MLLTFVPATFGAKTWLLLLLLLCWGDQQQLGEKKSCILNLAH